jgi:hypothetical protein
MDLQMFYARERRILLNTPLSLLFQADGFDLHKKKGRKRCAYGPLVRNTVIFTVRDFHYPRSIKGGGRI